MPFNTGYDCFKYTEWTIIFQEVDSSYTYLNNCSLFERQKYN